MNGSMPDNLTKDYVKRLQCSVAPRTSLVTPAQLAKPTRKKASLGALTTKALRLRMIQPFKSITVLVLRGLFHTYFFLADLWLVMRTR